jgi:hypothetical protein
MFSVNFLKDEITTLKRKREETKSSQNKYVRNQELERQKEEEYLKEQEERKRRKIEVVWILLYH